jgi:hypothetical protein
MSAGFGVEMYCLDGIRTGKVVRGRTALAQAIYRRLSTPRGTLRGGDEEAAYGLDLAGLVGRVSVGTAISALPGMIAAELSKEDRIISSLARVSQDASSNGLVSFTIEIDVIPEDESGDFTLTIAVSAVSAKFLGVSS